MRSESGSPGGTLPILARPPVDAHWRLGHAALDGGWREFQQRGVPRHSGGGTEISVDARAGMSATTFGIHKGIDRRHGRVRMPDTRRGIGRCLPSAFWALRPME
jgi:hypothetical protein